MEDMPCVGASVSTGGRRGLKSLLMACLDVVAGRCASGHALNILRGGWWNSKRRRWKCRHFRRNQPARQVYAGGSGGDSGGGVGTSLEDAFQPCDVGLGRLFLGLRQD